MSGIPTPVEVLRRGTESLSPGLQPSGELHDQVFACSTQYGGAYYAWCCRVLADHDHQQAARWREQARRALSAAVRHTTDPDAEPYASGFDARTLSVVSRLNHRDFTWPPILRTLTADQDPDPVLIDAVRRAEPERLFRTVPPSNWAAVWLSGEWLRMQAGLSGTTAEQLDDWLDVFFDRPEGTGFDLELGLYVERGIPNAYDLFTRVHLTDLLVNGYRGRNHDRLRTFLARGLQRSLALQLSDGSLASGYRSAGQTWVLAAQVALFHASIGLGLGSAAEADAARTAAWRAFTSLARWQRPGQPFSPVQNLLDPTLRVGYEAYTADGHYSPLALAFLATAVATGFGGHERPDPQQLDDRPAQAYVEAEPTQRGAAHRGRISVAVQARADGVYDATGGVDLTFGTDRWLHLVSSARSLDGGGWLVPGLAVRSAPSIAAPLSAVSSRRHDGPAQLTAGPGPSLSFSSTLEPWDSAAEADAVAGWRYTYQVTVTETGVDVVETLPGHTCARTLLVPYPRDLGTGEQTAAIRTERGVRLQHGREWLEIRLDEPVQHYVDRPLGYASRRGLCGLVRTDLAGPGDQLRWSVISSG